MEVFFQSVDLDVAVERATCLSHPLLYHNFCNASYQ